MHDNFQIPRWLATRDRATIGATWLNDATWNDVAPLLAHVPSWFDQLSHSTDDAKGWTAHSAIHRRVMGHMGLSPDWVYTIRLGARPTVRSSTDMFLRMEKKWCDENDFMIVLQ